jgi:hypothetical protein
MRENMSSFSWGDSVRVKAGAPEKRPGTIAAVVGIREIENEAQARQFLATIGGKVYLIEYADGIAVEVPEAWIESAEASVIP